MFTVRLAHLISRGVLFQVHEAVAIVQPLILTGVGAPLPENVDVSSDGSVTCVSASGPMSVADAARLLSTLLPPETRVPAALRYTIARGMGAVEAPPFDSLEAFSASLRRFEAGDRAEVVGTMLRRAAASTRTSSLVVTAEPPPEPKSTKIVPGRVAGSPRAAAELSASEEPDVLESTAGRDAQPSESRLPRGVWMALAVAAALIVSAVSGYILVLKRTPRHSAAVSPAITVSAPPVAVSGSSHTPALQEPLATAGRNAAAPSPEASVTAPPVDRPTDRVSAPRAMSGAVLPIRALPAADGPAFSPAFSNDGTAMFFHTGGPRDASSAIEMASPAGSANADLRVMTIVDDGARNYHAQPSPDGRLIAFDSDRGGERGIYLANRDGTNVHRISGAGYAAVPTWSPDGTRLAYIRAEADRPAVWNLWVKPLSDAEQRITHYRYGQTWGASWFPDSRRICYTHESTVTILDLTTGHSRQLASPIKGALARTPAVSPDGSKIVFQVLHHGAWMMNVADGSMVCILTDPTAEEFAWSPDGGRIAFHSKRDGRWGIYQLLEK